MSRRDQSLPLDVASLGRAYRERAVTPSQVVRSVLDRIAAGAVEGVWIELRDEEALLAEARTLETAFEHGARPPLYGVPYGVKDSIDVLGLSTTLACPSFAYLPGRSATVVERLSRAGAICIGKTNLDQFATGLVGTRSPYGIPPNAFRSSFVTGGSSSGAAASLARGQVSFSLATDTAGSGRVPAAFNHVVGFKPSRGLLSTRGLVPACRSVDCMSIMAFTCDDARAVAAVAAGFDPADPYSRPLATDFDWTPRPRRRLRVAVPREVDLATCDAIVAEHFERARGAFESLGAAIEETDMTPFFEAGRLLYEGPWVAERLSGLEGFLASHSDAVLPVIRTILSQGERYRATDAFRALQRLEELKREVAPVWGRCDALAVPPAPTFPTIDEAMRDPLGQNARLGLFTTFGNLLDLAAVSVPAGLRSDGLPSGVSLLGPSGRDSLLLDFAQSFQERAQGPLGATGWPWPSASPVEPAPRKGTLALAVVGAHLSGLALNRQLTDRGATLIRATKTAPSYRLFALPNTEPPKPGMLRVPDGSGVAIDVEVWAVPTEAVGSFLAGVAAPLAIGTIELLDGSRVHGFLCESHAVTDAPEISSFGGWRAYLAKTS